MTAGPLCVGSASAYHYDTLHNYGHCGSGVILSWGSALRVSQVRACASPASPLHLPLYLPRTHPRSHSQLAAEWVATRRPACAASLRSRPPPETAPELAQIAALRARSEALLSLPREALFAGTREP